MKRLLILAILVLGGTLLPPIALMAQLPFSFVYAPDNNVADTGLIRTVNSTTTVSSYKNASGQQQFTTKIKVIDLATMTNIYAQHMPLYTKSEPCELVYVPDDRSLVLLQDAVDPATMIHHNYFTRIDYTIPTIYRGVL